MKHSSEVPDLTDTDLEDHITYLQSKLDRITISLQLATAERNRRQEHNILSSTGLKSDALTHRLKTVVSPPALQLGSRVRILNKYKGNKGRIGRVIELSSRTATVHIPERGNFIKQHHNLEVLASNET